MRKGKLVNHLLQKRGTNMAAQTTGGVKMCIRDRIITGNGQPLFQGRLCNLKDCIELLVTGGGSLAGSLKNCEAVFR